MIEWGEGTGGNAGGEAGAEVALRCLAWVTV